MNILIIGSGSKEYTLAKLLKSYESTNLVFVAPGNEATAQIADCVDIKANNVEDLMDFAKANEIDFTIACSEQAIINNIADKFNEAGLMIFAPSSDAARICTNKSAAKKFMYKTKIPTSKFGIFDRENMAVEYARKSPMPLVIKTDTHLPGENTIVCESFKMAKRVIEESFNSQNKKLVIEDYAMGQEFSYYIITDGYNALPLGSVVPYKYALDGDGGLITSGVGAYAPSYMLTHDVQRRIFNEIIFPALDELNKNNNPYVGILGIDVILDRDGKLNVLEFNSFLQEPDAECIFALTDENWVDIMQAAVRGTLNDIYPEIKTLPLFAVSTVLNAGNYPVSGISGKVIEGLDDVDEEVSVSHFRTAKTSQNKFETIGGRTLSVTAKGATLQSAVEKVYENIALIKFEGKKFRKDIAKTLDSQI